MGEMGGTQSRQGRQVLTVHPTATMLTDPTNDTKETSFFVARKAD
jgi:hypothetical protein